MELQLMPASKQDEDEDAIAIACDDPMQSRGNDSGDGLQLSIGLCEQMRKEGFDQVTLRLGGASDYVNLEEDGIGAEQAREELRMAAAEKAYAEHAREMAKMQMELAEAEFASAKRIREQAQAELQRAEMVKEEATRRINATCMEITCQECRQHFQFQLPWAHQGNRNCAPAITDENINEDSYLSLQLMLPTISTSTSKPQQN